MERQESLPSDTTNAYRMYQQHVQTLNQQQHHEMPPADARSTANSVDPESLHGVVKKCLGIFAGRRSCTPTASLPNTHDMGILMFLNLKQAHLNHATRGVDLYRYPALKPLLSIIEFINYVVGGLIVEAEKIDEMHITIKKEMIKRRARIDYQRQDIKVRSKGVGTQVHQVLSAHFPSKALRTAPRSRALNTNMSVHALEGLTQEEVDRIHDQQQSVEDDKWVLQQLTSHLRTACVARSLLHGKSAGGVDPNVADGVVQELNIAQTFRKAMHKIKDCLNEVEDKSSLPALQTLSQFLDYLHYGVAVALDELETCEVLLRKRGVGESAERKMKRLDARDKENKRASCSALRFNSVVNSPKKTHSHANTSHLSALNISALGPSALMNTSAEPAPSVSTTIGPQGSVAAHFGYVTGEGRRVFDARPDARALTQSNVPISSLPQELPMEAGAGGRGGGGGGGGGFSSRRSEPVSHHGAVDDFLDAYCCE